jgi:hypothetical protein
MGVLPQSLEIIFKVQREKEQWKNNKKKNKLSIYKHVFFFFPSLWTLLHSNLVTILFLIILNNLKCYRSATWCSTNHLWTLAAPEQHTKNLLGVQESAFVIFGGLFSWVLNPSFLWGNITFSFLIHFQRLLVCLMCQEEGFRFVWTSETTTALLLYSACPWAFKCLVTGRSTLMPIKYFPLSLFTLHKAARWGHWWNQAALSCCLPQAHI